MGRVFLFLLVLLAVWLLWRAFGPGSQQRFQSAEANQPPAIKGPDDDEEFLWNIEKTRFKERRAREEAERRAREEEELRKKFGEDLPDSDNPPES
ncbi:hypothetical protein QP027_01135 [Corynebacterium breve]|uniref:Secreted protein n=1 Tax=Corynebacterium breve TaxID=3049799 RepID=A0ABY8VGY5_9CORY|nr:hypothetical protein [Corynebacterium breve]WIM68035.1 hypothetical protein QP027_01135 [Corynebacterium breve]